MDHCCLTLLPLPLEDHSREGGGSSHTAFPRYEGPAPQVVRGRVIAGCKPMMRIADPGLLRALEPVLCEGGG